MTLYRILVYNKYLQFYAQFRQINIRQFLHGSIFMGHSRRFSYLPYVYLNSRVRVALWIFFCLFTSLLKLDKNKI